MGIILCTHRHLCSAAALPQLETFEEYYQSAVKSILTTVTAQLALDPARRFTFVEMAYMERWWRDQNATVKAQVRQLVAADR